MEAKEPTWFIRLQGHTLGPLSTEELKASVREGEIAPADKVNLSGTDEWQTLSDHQDLFAYWQNFHQKSPLSFDLPSPTILWKKSPPPLPIVVAEPISQPAPTEKPAVRPAPVAKPSPAKAKSQKIKTAKKPKAAKAKKAAPVIVVKPVAPREILAEPSPLVAEGEELQPIAPAPLIPEISREEKKPPKVETIAVFPERPAVPEIRQQFFGENAKKKSGNQKKALRIAALVIVVLTVAVIAYWAGQKTRDLKEFPLPDPSSPTSQPPAASDPIQPLRAPTRPQRD